MNRAWDNYWFGPVAAIRPFLFSRSFLLLIGVDAILLMARRGSRYGVDGFNVAHVAWLDAIQPLPTASWYVGVLVLVAVLALSMAVAGPWRPGLALLAGLYTYSWVISRHDSYLHHYMSSWILLSLVFFPRVPARQLVGSSADALERSAGRWWLFAAAFWMGLLVYRVHPQWNRGWGHLGIFLALVALLVAAAWRGQAGIEMRQTSAWGYRMLGAQVGVIYIFTSIAKMDGPWCAGYTIQQVGQVTQVLAPLVRAAEAVGVPAEWFWSSAATAVIPLELFIASSYFLAVRQDEAGRVWTRRWCLAGWAAAIGLHLNNEMMHLSIQWFSYYMIFLATMFLAPSALLWRLGMVIVWPACALPAHLETWGRQRPRRQRVGAVVASALAASGSLAAAAWLLQMPGGWWALPVAGAAALAGALAWVVRRREAVAVRILLSVAAAGGLIQLMAVGSNVRFDYYDLLGRTVQRLGTPDPARSGINHGPEYEARMRRQFEALAAFEQALRFARPHDPGRALVYNNMGLAYRRLGEYHLALGDRQRGDRFYRLAVEHYRRAVEADPSSPLPPYNLGVTYHHLGDEGQALRWYRRALRIKSDLSDAMVNIGIILERQGKLRQALECYRAARRVEPNAPDIGQHVQRVLAGIQASGK